MHNIGNNLPTDLRRQYFTGQCRTASSGRQRCLWRVKAGYSANQVAQAFYQHWLSRYGRFEASVRRVFAGEIDRAWS